MNMFKALKASDKISFNVLLEQWGHPTGWVPDLGQEDDGQVQAPQVA